MKTKLLLLNLFFAFTAFSQETPLLPQIIPVSPQAMELIKHINYPVDLSNGLVKIDIPIYEITDGDIKLPITLSYHASGLKVNQHSEAWIGDGWRLNTGPTVTRRVVGLPDEDYQTYNNNVFINNAVATGSADVALDEYYYSTLNNSGKFVIKRYPGPDWIKKAILLPYAPISIEPNWGANSGVTQMVDNLGYTYTFNTPADQAYDGSQYVETTWKVTSIASKKTGSKIDFTYTVPITQSMPESPADYIKVLDNAWFGMDNFSNASGYSTYITDSAFPLVLKRDATTSYPQFFGVNFNTGAVDTEEASINGFPTSVWDNYNAIKSSYNKEILFQGGKVVFERSADCLSAIKVFADNDFTTPVKTIKFHQHYQYPLQEDRLSLDSISFFGRELVSPAVYRFSYNPYVASPSDSRSIDLWGYLNNGSENSTLVPSFSIDRGGVEISFPGANREPDEENMQGGILESIKYPTGAETKFHYEAHRVAGVNGFALAGGLRIRQIETIDEQNTKYYRNFRYGTWDNKESGLGLRQFSDGDIFSIDNHSYQKEFWIDNLTTTNHSSWNEIHETTYACNSLANLFSESGSSVAYPFVTEYQSKDSDNLETIGRTEYQFNIVPPSSWRYPGTNFTVEYFDGWKSGEQMSKLTYKNSVLQPIEKDTTAFSLQVTNNPDSIVTQTYVFKDRMFLGLNEELFPTYDRPFTVYQNDIVTGSKRAVLSKKTIYTGAVEDSETYTYDVFGNLKSTTSVNSDGSSNASVVKYPRDMVIEGRDQTGVFQDMVDNNMVSVPVENVAEKDNDFIQKTYTGYSKPFGTFFSPNVIKTTAKGHNEETRLLFNQYDSRGNILEQQKADGSKAVYVWGYKSQYPIAEIKNADYATVVSVLGGQSAVDAFVVQPNPSESTVNSFLAGLRTSASLKDALITTYTYKPLVGMASMTDPKGTKTTYQYDASQRLESIKDASGNIMQAYQYHYKP